MMVRTIEGDTAVVDAAGTSLNVNISFLETPKVGDYVLVHAGFAIRKIDEGQAEETIKLLNDFISSPPSMGGDKGEGE